MRTVSLFLLIVLLSSFTNWETNFDKAKQTAKTEHKYILLNFSGSDWCGPCIRLKKEIFESEVFKAFADDQLVLVNADFPRSKRNQLSKEQVKLNESLADKYNPKGIFPLTLVLNADGKVLKTYDGFPGISAQDFTNEIKKLNNTGK